MQVSSPMTYHKGEKVFVAQIILIAMKVTLMGNVFMLANCLRIRIPKIQM